jgi:hypothetical protein
MAAKRDEDSKQGLIIALVVFVLLSIVLGVTTYFGFDGQQALRDKAKQSDDKLKAMEKSRDWEAFQKLYLKDYVGQPFTAKEKDEFAASLQRYTSNQLGDPDTKPEFDTLYKLVQDKMGWDATTSAPKRTYLARVDELEKAVQQEKDLRKKADEANKVALDNARETLNSNQKSTDKLKEQLAQANKELAELNNKKSAEFMTVTKQNQERDAEIDKAKKEIADAQDDKNKQEKKYSKLLQEKDNKIGQLNDQIKPPYLLDYDKPKGRIINVERGQPVVYINLGSADRVKPQLTFAIHGVGPNGKRVEQRKGTLEVTDVKQAHLSQARITEWTDASHDPIMQGDLLFNPVWNSSLRTHVAIAGVIDLTGEGTNDTADFIKGLERQDVVVDAWLDLKDLAIKGPGMTNKTTYLVLGDRPEFGEIVGAGDRLSKDKEALIKKMSEMQDEGAKLGVTVVPYRRFLAVIGYPLPRVLTSRASSSNVDSLLLTTGAGRREAEKEKGDKAAPNGKPKGDKDEVKDKEK